MLRYLQRTTVVFLTVFFTLHCQRLFFIGEVAFFTDKVIQIIFTSFLNHHHISFFRLILRLFPTTLTLENAIAPAAIIGLNKPSAASGIAATL